MKVENKVIVILGPTASGKTKLAVSLARHFNGEIISADSRQVYVGMDIGTGKDLKDYAQVPYHLINVASPKTQFSVAKFQKRARQAIRDIHRRGKLPVVVGGTGLYISALTQGYELVGTGQMSKSTLQLVRKKLEAQSLPALLRQLKKIDPATYKVIDQKNRRRVQRAVEIYKLYGQPKSKLATKSAPPLDFFILGIKIPKARLERNIHRRLLQRIKQGMVAEVKRLRASGVSWKRLEDFGLEYRWVSRYLRGNISKAEMLTGLDRAIRQFAKRQMTWFKRDKQVIWVNSQATARRLIRDFLKW